MRFGLLGRKLGHSYSPMIFDLMGGYEYLLHEREPEGIEDLLKNGDFDGLNVTIPYKKEVLPYLDEVDPLALRLGAVNTIVKNRTGEVSSCDLLYRADLSAFNEDYLQQTTLVAESCQDHDLSESCMVIGTSAIVNTELDGVVGMNSGIFNNPFLFWGRYRKKLFRYSLPISFQFHHTQMDGAHAGRFLKNLQKEINRL